MQTCLLNGKLQNFLVVELLVHLLPYNRNTSDFLCDLLKSLFFLPSMPSEFSNMFLLWLSLFILEKDDQYKVLTSHAKKNCKLSAFQKYVKVVGQEKEVY